jgi:ABC-type branched-subunit amino acid transport system ATPase component
MAASTVVRLSLECVDVDKSFGLLKALDKVTFKLEGSIIKGLVGPNGSGKSTLINTITNVPYGADRGKIIFNGRNIERAKPQEICKNGIGRTFQGLTFFPSLTVEQNLLVGSSAVGTSDEVVRNALDVTELSEKRHLKSSALSVFELKRLMIATSLSIDPKLVLLDEPLSGLSEEESNQTLEIVRKINKMDKAVLIIEHKLRKVLNLCDELLVLHLGKVLADGKPGEVIKREEVARAYFGERSSTEN